MDHLHLITTCLPQEPHSTHLSQESHKSHEPRERVRHTGAPGARRATLRTDEEARATELPAAVTHTAFRGYYERLTVGSFGCRRVTGL